jgi:peptide/nickel transport system substrate-binding protein
MKTPFFQTFWGTRSLDPQILQCLDAKAPYNETQWKAPRFDAITAQARGTLDESKRRELYHEAQQMLHDQGGYIIWGFPDNLDGYRANVGGLKPSAVRNLGWYGFEEVWLA